MRNSPYHKGERGKAEKLAAKIIKSQPCIHCGSKAVDPAHLFQRSSAATCTDLRCIVPLCRVRHSYIDTHPAEKERFAKRLLGANYDELRLRTNTATKINWQERLEELKDYWRALESGEMTLKDLREYED